MLLPQKNVVDYVRLGMYYSYVDATKKYRIFVDKPVSMHLEERERSDSIY